MFTSLGIVCYLAGRKSIEYDFKHGDYKKIMSYNGSIEVSVSDVDFYQRKIIRLEDDISILHEELAKLRTRLRVAEDYEIKYHILLKNSEAELMELREKT
jgi:hypothetical protein